VTASFNSKKIMSMNIPSLSSPNGFVATGPDRFGIASFDNINISRADVTSMAEAALPRYQDLKFVSDSRRTKQWKNMVDSGREELLQQHVDKLGRPQKFRQGGA